jgi:FixJ family two-component response regulator
MTAAKAVVHVVDDDASFRASLVRLLRANGLAAEGYDSAPDFLRRRRPDGAGCVVLDVRMPGVSGLGLQEELAAEDCAMPVIFLTGHGDVPTSVRAMKKGAVDFLTKPVDEEIVLAAIRHALSEDEIRSRTRREISAVRERIRTLTAREREVMQHVIAGELNKQIGDRLGVAEKTVKVHRARVMAKMGVNSVAELVRLCLRAGIAPASDGPREPPHRTKVQ